MTKRVKILYSPSGEPKVGTVMTVSDHQAELMIGTGRVELHTDAPASAGTTTTGAPSEAAQQLNAQASTELPKSGSGEADAAGSASGGATK
jgi:hypothetical protein